MTTTANTTPSVPAPSAPAAEPENPILSLSFDDCLRRKNELLGSAASFNELTQEQLEEFYVLSTRLRQLAQPAGKPPSGKRAAKTSAPAATLDDFG